MAEQRLHSALAPLDLLTRLEMEQVLHKGLDEAVRARYWGVDEQRLPVISAPGNGGTLTLAATGSSAPCGPSQGDVWLIRHIMVASRSLTIGSDEPAGFVRIPTYAIFRNSTPSDPTSFNERTLFDAVNVNPNYVMTTAPAVPASTVNAQNSSNQPYTVFISGGTITGISVNGNPVNPASTSVVVPPFGFINITYSVAPTWTWVPFLNGVSSQIGLPVSTAYRPATKAFLLQSGEQVCAQVYGSIATDNYVLTGEAIRVPAEMKGKLLS